METNPDIEQLHHLWKKIARKYCDDEKLIDMVWKEILNSYTEPHRFYHNLNHISFMCGETFMIRDKIKSFDAFIASIFFHDIVYEIMGNDNEEKSKEVAAKTLDLLGFPKELIDQCKLNIMATKDHKATSDKDANYLIDIDLAIMSQDEKTYKEYVSNIRKESFTISDEQFNTARRKIVNDFLSRERIYTTEEFFTKYEASARRNLLSY